MHSFMTHERVVAAGIVHGRRHAATPCPAKSEGSSHRWSSEARAGRAGWNGVHDTGVGMAQSPTRFLGADHTRAGLPFRFSIADYLPRERVVLFGDALDVADL